MCYMLCPLLLLDSIVLIKLLYDYLIMNYGVSGRYIRWPILISIME